MQAPTAEHATTRPFIWAWSLSIVWLACFISLLFWPFILGEPLIPAEAYWVIAIIAAVALVAMALANRRWRWIFPVIAISSVLGLLDATLMPVSYDAPRLIAPVAVAALTASIYTSIFPNTKTELSRAEKHLTRILVFGGLIAVVSVDLLAYANSFGYDSPINPKDLIGHWQEEYFPIVYEFTPDGRLGHKRIGRPHIWYQVYTLRGNYLYMPNGSDVHPGIATYQLVLSRDKQILDMHPYRLHRLPYLPGSERP